MKSGNIKRFKSEGYRTVEKSKEEIEKDVAKALREKFGRGQNYRFTRYGPSNMLINDKISSKGNIKGQLFTGGASRRKLSKEAREIYDHGNRSQLARRGSELRYWE